MYLPQDHIKAVIFDLDGTLIDSMPGHVAAWKSVFADAGHDIPEAFFYRHEGMLDWEKLQGALAKNGRPVGKRQFERLIDEQRRLYLAKYAPGVKLFPEAERLVEDLSRKAKLALVTSSDRKVIPGFLFDWLENRFDRIVTRDMVNRGKPHPEPFIKALEMLGLDNGLAVVVENAPAGILAAKAAGLMCLAVATTLQTGELSDADRVFSSHEELGAWFDTNIRKPD